MKGYETFEQGFRLKLDLRLYEREAVMKALYHFREQYMISYEVEDRCLYVYFETSAPKDDYGPDVNAIMKALDFQMMRLDTIRRTRGMRELLVARALYATCIEPERQTSGNADEDEVEDWHADQNRIFSSWAGEL